jgi:tRNA nucleotidyltransferase/poly(A) polymerase
LEAFQKQLGGHSIVLDPAFGIYRYWVDGMAFDLAQMQGDICQDLKRRDLTINALALGPLSEEMELLDPTGGLGDLRLGLIRVPCKQNIADDPLRLLRVFRFAATLDFAVAPETLAWCEELAVLIARPAGERIAVELYKLFCAPSATTLVLMHQCGLLTQVFPELTPLLSLPPNQHHHLNAFEHSLESVRMLEALLAAPEWMGTHREAVLAYLEQPLGKEHHRFSWLKLATLLHDVGKAETFQMDEGRPRFIGHDQCGATIGALVANRLRLSGIEREFIEDCIRHHMRPGLLSNRTISEKAIYRFFRDTGASGVAVLLVSYADRLSAQGPAVTSEDNDRHREAVLKMLDTYYKPEGFVPPRLLNGHQLMQALNIPAGPQVGTLLEAITEAQITGDVHTPEEALTWARHQIGQ